MFEKASRLKIRFATPQGAISVEDLWDIPLTSTTNKANLNDIAKGLNKAIKSDDEDFVGTSKKTNTSEKLAFEIVKHVIAVRVAENEALALAAANRKKKQDILALISQKENEQMSSLHIDDLRKLAESL